MMQGLIWKWNAARHGFSHALDLPNMLTALPNFCHRASSKTVQIHAQMALNQIQLAPT